jgi:hypothetical protein
MTTVFTWTVTAIDCYPQVEGQTNVAVNVHWTLVGVQDTYRGSVYSVCAVPAPAGSFTPYADLTQDQVLGWVWANGVDKAIAEAAVQTQIDAQVNPPVVTPPLPWIVN